VVTENADWTDALLSGTGAPAYLEITSGTHAGLATDVLGSDAAQRIIRLRDDFATLLTGGERIEIHPHWTLGTLFGPNNEAGLGAGNNISADEILIYDPIAQAYTTYFYKTSGLGGVGWRSTASTSRDCANDKIDFARGLLIRRKQPADLKVRIYGVARAGKKVLAIHPGLNMAPNVYPGEGLTLGNSSLYTGDSRTGLAAGSNVSADKVLIYNGASYDVYYYKNAGIGGTGWRSTLSTSTDCSQIPLPCGTSVLIERAKDLPSFFWCITQPY
jgi:uncharacterized protein (TIGR02597 family)